MIFVALLYMNVGINAEFDSFEAKDWTCIEILDKLIIMSLKLIFKSNNNFNPNCSRKLASNTGFFCITVLY